jgi:hypothetical protein
LALASIAILLDRIDPPSLNRILGLVSASGDQGSWALYELGSRFA